MKEKLLGHMYGFYATCMVRKFNYGVRIYSNLEYFQYIRGTKIYDVVIAHRHDK